MADLLQSQIQESCRLALPEGLKDLMSDISREVLRAQPGDLMEFITDYLSALLVTRENLSIASRVCADICDCGCQPELEGELKNIGLFEEDVAVATEIILEHFYNGEVQEASIIMKILKRIDIDEDQLLDVQNAIRKAFIRHQTNHTTIYQSSSDSDKDEIDTAVRHTLKVYRKTKPSDAEYEAMAKKIQASYRAYGVQRYCQVKHKHMDELKRTIQRNVKLVSPGASGSKITVHEVPSEAHFHISPSNESQSKLCTVSSTSLAGSYLYLPRFKPYSVHDTLSDLEETPERENAHIDYTAEHPHVSIYTEKPLFRERKISFQDDDDDYVPEVIHYEVEIHDDDLLREQIDEEIAPEEEIEDSDINDENVVAVDLDVENSGNESAADDDKTQKYDDQSSKYDANKRGLRHRTSDDDETEYKMYKELSTDFFEKDDALDF